jgi:hypothetical protein
VETKTAMDLTTWFEPIRIIHWDWTGGNYLDVFDNKTKTGVQIIRGESRNLGLAIVMTSHLTSTKGIFLSYITEQDVIIVDEELQLLDIGQFIGLLRNTRQFCEEAFFERIGENFSGSIEFRFPSPDQESMNLLFDSLKKAL